MRAGSSPIGPVSLVDALQMQPAQEFVMVTEVAGQRLHPLWDLRAHAGRVHRGEHVRRSRRPSISAASIRLPGDSEDIGGQVDSLIPASSRSFSNRCASRLRLVASAVR